MEVSRFRDFYRWWKSELLDCLPKKLIAKLLQRKVHFIGIADEKIQTYQPTKNIGTLPPKSSKTFAGQNELTEFLTQLKRRFWPTSVVVLISDTSCFIRRTKIPLNAVSRGDSILAQDVTRLTPSKSEPMMADWYVTDKNRQSKTCTMVQTIAKQSAISVVLAAANSTGLALSACRVIEQNGKIAPINLLGNWYENPQLSFAWMPGANRALATACALMVVSATGLEFNRQNTAIVQLEQDVWQLRKKAKSVSQQIAEIRKNSQTTSSLYHRKSASHRIVAVWEEISKLLPDTAWLLNVSIKKNNVQITGVAKSAAKLIERIEASNMFMRAAFSSPVVALPAQEKEQFAIKFQLVSSVKARVDET